MKIIIITLIISMFVLVELSAQQSNSSESKIKWGVKAGLNLANATGSGIEFLTGSKGKANTKLGIVFGALLEYKLSTKFSLQPELLYSQQGFVKKTAGENYVLHLNYINIPLMAKYYPSKKFSIAIGPQFGFLLSSKFNSKETLGQTAVRQKIVKNKNETTDVDKYFKKTDFGINFSLGYQLENGLGLNAGYYLGIKNIFKYKANIRDARKLNTSKSVQIAENNYSIKNNLLNLTVFYTF